VCASGPEGLLREVERSRDRLVDRMGPVTPPIELTLEEFHL